MLGHTSRRLLTPTVRFFCFSPFSAVLRALSQFAAAVAAAGVGLHEELHLHHRETLRLLQQEVRPPGCVQRSQCASRHVSVTPAASTFILYTYPLCIYMFLNAAYLLIFNVSKVLQKIRVWQRMEIYHDAYHQILASRPSDL